jgi:hypothetical protein
MFGRIEHAGQGDLPHIAHAPYAGRALSRGPKRGHDQGRKNSDDGYHDQEFHK